MARRPPPEELGPFQFAVLLLSLALLVGLAAESLFDVPHEVERLVFFIDTAVCGVLFVDFVIRYRAAAHKLAFMKWGWVDLLACVPAIELFRYGRILRIVRVIRIIVAIRSLRRFMELLLESKARAGVAAVFVIGFMVVSFGSAGVLLTETMPDSNIVTAEDALWWSLATVTTVGYGDHYPVTTAGRTIAAFVMISGIGIFGTLSGVAAGFFLGDKSEPASSKAQQEILAQVGALQRELVELRERGASPPPPPSAAG